MKKKLAVILAAALSLTCATTSSFKSEAANGTWSSDSGGWWYAEGGWYPSGQWYEIDGYWYYFLSSGYMDYSEYRDGCWLNEDGSWNTAYSGGHWASDSTGWWYADNSGWYPTSEWLWIDGSCYYFKDSGYMACNESVGGSWVGADGAWDPNHKDSGSGSGESGDGGSDDGDDGSEDRVLAGWKQKAVDQVKEVAEDDKEDGVESKWAYIYLDNDNIPELVCYRAYDTEIYKYTEKSYYTDRETYEKIYDNDGNYYYYIERGSYITNNVYGPQEFDHDYDPVSGKDIEVEPHTDTFTYFWEMHSDQQLFNVFYLYKRVSKNGTVQYYKESDNDATVADMGYDKAYTKRYISESEYNNLINSRKSIQYDDMVGTDALIKKIN